MANLNVLVSVGETPLAPQAYESVKPLLESEGIAEVSDWRAADLRLVLGGDGSMLHEARKDIARAKVNRAPILGLKAGNPFSKGMLLNEVDFSDLESIRALMEEAETQRMHYLRIFAETVSGLTKQVYAFNDTNFFRKASQTAAYRVLLDGRERMERAMGDGLLLSTPQGSTAYNLSVGGTVASTDEALVLSGISSRTLKSIMLPQSTKVEVEVLEPQKRPQRLEADGQTVVSNVRSAIIETAQCHFSDLRFDPKLTFKHKLVKEALKS